LSQTVGGKKDEFCQAPGTGREGTGEEPGASSGGGEREGLKKKTKEKGRKGALRQPSA